MVPIPLRFKTYSANANSVHEGFADIMGSTGEYIVSKNKPLPVKDSTWMSALPWHSIKCQKALMQVTLSHLHK